ncbi:hypothetical protein IB278_33335 [Variovorax sp. VRV01]|nr:hypothetical protein [Variovorax sp. VRV01]
MSAIAEAIGWTPLLEIGLAAMCNDSKDHRILGDMALWLSERASGVVDLGGEISELGDQATKVSYQTAAGHISCFSVLDPEGLRAWLGSTSFRMVK